jgi:hypothetical protein
MISSSTAVATQLVLLVYHQLTTLVDLYPFNGVRNYTVTERYIEAGVNAFLMSLPILGFSLGITGLMWFGVIYYPLLFVMELTIWWVPYLCEPRGTMRRTYNLLLAVATSNFASRDALNDWQIVYRRIYPGTISILPLKEGRIVPNLEHTLLHLWTLITALLTFFAFTR